MMTLEDIQREIAALPPTLSPPLTALGSEAIPGTNGSLKVVSKQGRLILRLAAAVEGLEARTRELADEAKTHRKQAEEAAEALRLSERRERLMALEAIHLMDALDWAGEATGARGEDKLAREILSAQRDCLRRLAVLGVTEIGAARGAVMDGRLHEGLDSTPAGDDNADVPQYHILSLVRRGYQLGPDVLRLAGVTTIA